VTIAVEPEVGRQAISSGVPELVLDGREGPAANLGGDQSERIVASVVDVVYDVGSAGKPGRE
jgi:hypothetical protein